jgi:hypothetical protein
MLFLPVFFALYRVTAFGTVPRDDYVPFLLWLLGAPGGAFPESPYGYRIGSMVLAAVFYHLPALPLTNLPPSLTPEYLHATAALAMLSYVSMLAGAGLMGYRARRAGLPVRDALLAAGLFLGLCGFTQYFAIDPLALCWIALCGFALPYKWPFAVLILVSPLLNEKIVIVLGLSLTARCLLDREARAVCAVQWLCVLAAGAGYVAMLRGLALPGNAYQLHPGGYVTTLVNNLLTSLSPRGLVLNILPTLLVGTVGLAAWCGRRLVPRGCFHPADLLALPGLALVGLVLTETLQIGRILAHAAPLLVVPAAAWLGRRIAHEA